ncbi:hypothetical protein [Acinetobacter bereziniae]|uniref:hypothetical protein n=1 Tax=Acinetobacter bereziniae TaxID=106648 RepID=UPI003AF807FE
MNIWVETIKVKLSKNDKDEFVIIDIKDFGVDCEILFSQSIFTAIKLPEMQLPDKSLKISDLGYIACQKDPKIVTDIISQFLTHILNNQFEIKSIDSDEAKHNLVDIEKIKKFESA